MATTPQLGYGQRGEAPINAVNQWMRSTDWYQSLIKSFGQQPTSVHLTEAQKTQVIRAAQAHGVVVDEGGNGQEIDDSGNFQAKGHKLRNTLIVAGIAGAALATMGAAGVFAGGAGAASGGGAAAGGAAAAGSAAALGPSTAASIAATAAAAGAPAGIAATSAGVGTGLAGVAAAAGTKGLSYADILKYGVPTAGNIIGGVIQANAAGKASDAQQRYLEEALAYEKEKDTYQRGVDAAAVAREAQRYGDYQGRIAPWIANGTNSNDRMAALLGLPARAGSSSGGRGDDTRSIDVGDAPDKFYAAMQDAGLNPVSVQGHGQTIVDAINKKYPGLGATVDPTTDAVVWPGLGPIDVTVDSGKGGWSFRPSGSYTPTSTTPPARSYAATQPTATAPEPPQVRPPAAAVQLRAPDGSVKSVPADQVDHYLKLGATQIGAAA